MACNIPIVISTTDYSKQVTQKFKLFNLNLVLYIRVQNMLYRQKVFGRTVNEKCLVSEIHTHLNQLNLCEVRNVDNGNSNK